MSKKNRLKKKKLKLQKRINEFVPEVEEKEDNSSATEVQEIKQKKTEKQSVDDSIIDIETRKLISKDVKLIIITLAVLAALLVGVKILQTKTDVINSFGDWLYKITNIQTM